MRYYKPSHIGLILSAANKIMFRLSLPLSISLGRLSRPGPKRIEEGFRGRLSIVLDRRDRSQSAVRVLGKGDRGEIRGLEFSRCTISPISDDNFSITAARPVRETTPLLSKEIQQFRRTVH